MNNMDIEKLVNEEMMRIDDEQLKNIAHVLWMLYTSFVREGFTEQQAISLVAASLSPKIGG